MGRRMKRRIRAPGQKNEVKTLRHHRPRHRPVWWLTLCWPRCHSLTQFCVATRRTHRIPHSDQGDGVVHECTNCYYYVVLCSTLHLQHSCSCLPASSSFLSLQQQTFKTLALVTSHFLLAATPHLPCCCWHPSLSTISPKTHKIAPSALPRWQQTPLKNAQRFLRTRKPSKKPFPY